MPLELKGLKTTMRSLQARVDRLNAIATKADEKGAMLESHLGDMHSQLGAHVDDIEFAANVLGNSGNGSSEPEKPVERSFLAPGHRTADPALLKPDDSVSPLEVGQAAVGTFPDTTRDDL